MCTAASSLGAKEWGSDNICGDTVDVLDGQLSNDGQAIHCRSNPKGV